MYEMFLRQNYIAFKYYIIWNKSKESKIEEEQHY